MAVGQGDLRTTNPSPNGTLAGGGTGLPTVEEQNAINQFGMGAGAPTWVPPSQQVSGASSQVSATSPAPASQAASSPGGPMMTPTSLNPEIMRALTSFFGGSLGQAAAQTIFGGRGQQGQPVVGFGGQSQEQQSSPFAAAAFPQFRQP